MPHTRTNDMKVIKIYICGIFVKILKREQYQIISTKDLNLLQMSQVLLFLLTCIEVTEDFIHLAVHCNHNSP